MVWETYFGQYLSVKSSEGGGDTPKFVLGCVQEGHKVLCVLDYDVSGNHLLKLKTMLNDEYKSNVLFLTMECFEHVICGSNMILKRCTDAEKDIILNYTKYMSCDFLHRGEYFHSVVKRIFKSYNGNVCYTKNKTDCLTKDCCSRRSFTCRFHTNNKVKDLLQGEFSVLWELYSSLSETK